MRFSNEISVDAQPDELFAFVSDPEQVVTCLPGASVEGRDGDDWRGAMSMKVGPIKASYRGTLRFLELDPDARRAVMRVRADEASGQGQAEARIVSEIEERDGAACIRMETDLQIRGKVAQFGRGAMEQVAGRMLERFADNVEKAIAGETRRRPRREAASTLPLPRVPARRLVGARRRRGRLRRRLPDRPVAVKAADFDYYRVDALEDALERLGELGEDAKVLAGGQSLVPMMNFRLARPAALVDITRVEELRGIERDNGELRIRAATTHAEVEHAAELEDGYEVMRAAAKWVGHEPIRSRGTFGGSLAHADPTAEWCLIAVALGAVIEIAGPARRARGPRRGVPARLLHDRARAGRDRHRGALPRALPAGRDPGVRAPARRLRARGRGGRAARRRRAAHRARRRRRRSRARARGRAVLAGARAASRRRRGPPPRRSTRLRPAREPRLPARLAATLVRRALEEAAADGR